MSKRRRLLSSSFESEGLIKVLGANDFKYGYTSNGYAPNNDYTAPHEYRGIYVPFDILTESGHYTVSTPNQPDLYFTIEFFSSTQLQQVANGQVIGSVHFTSGWRNQVYDFYLPISGQDIAGFRIVLGKGSSQNEIVDMSLNPYFEIRREDENVR